MVAAWVIGSNGLLGSALRHELALDRTPPFVPAARFDWADPVALRQQLTAAVGAFADWARAASRWEIYWAAGVGTMRSQPHELETETAAFRTLLEGIHGHEVLRLREGRIVLASSAGAIYAGSDDPIITEHTPRSPTTAYALAKLAQEAALEAFASSMPRCRGVIGRLSTLYGAGHARDKQQGLVSNIARRIVMNLPIHIFVPLDTIRDYIAAEDAAGELIFLTRSDATAAGPQGATLMRIIADGKPTTISEILAIFRSIARRAPRVVTSRSAASSIYSPQINFRPIALGEYVHRVSLVVGIKQVLEAERHSFVRGQTRMNA